MNCITKVVSPLEKVFYDDKISKFKSYPKSSALIGEKHNFCIIYTNTDYAECRYSCSDIYFSLVSDIKEHISVRSIEHVPAVYSATIDETPDDLLRTMPGLFPDVLVPVKENQLIPYLPRILNSLWIEVDTENIVPGKHKITVNFFDSKGNKLSECTHTVKVINAKLPEQKLLVTHWFHTDCLADYYNVKVFSKEHWIAIEKFLKRYKRSGSNVIYTPLFTPPLDTRVGGERTTVQLVDVIVNNGKYEFGFEKLHKWVSICKDAGLEYFEMSHLFTQWGAYHAPKIIAKVDGKTKKIFGWETDAHGKEYDDFLAAFLPALLKELEKLQIGDKTFFHISDEPTLDHLDSYKACSDIIRKHLNGYKIMDAMAHVEFFERGYMDIPIPYLKNAKPFLDMNPDLKFVYYCGVDRECMGRGFSMPSSRNRISGAIFYDNKIDGFLFWGHNFYNAAYSTRHIDPYAVTDADRRFCSGDSFMVYPGADFESYESIRLAVFRDGLQDMRALELCEALCGVDATKEVLSRFNGNQPLDLCKTPQDKDFTLKVRETINEMIEKALQ